MATLRDSFFIRPEDSKVSTRFKDDLEVSGMNSLSRGWEAGRIGTEANALSADELSLRASGDVEGANALRQQIGALQQRQGAYAPSVGRVEDINSVGDGLSWAAGQVGQGVASMVDPIAVSAGINTVGRFLPGAYGKVAQVAGLAAPYLMNQRQLTGEFGNTAYQDPELIARTSPTQLRDSANTYGAGAAVIDTALPGMIGRQLSGVSRAGSAGARASAKGPLGNTVAGMGMEGATEAFQAQGSQAVQGYLNPNRDTSGDDSEIINSFAGGAIGSGPLTAAGAYAEAGHNRVGAGVDSVKDAAGTVIDMANQNETVQGAVQGGKKLWGSAKAKAGETVDLMKDDDGEVSFKAATDNLKSAGEDLYAGMKSKVQMSAEEDELLAETKAFPDEKDIGSMSDDDIMKWVADHEQKKAEMVDAKLTELGDDPEAQRLQEAIRGATDREGSINAIDEAGRYLAGQTFSAQAQRRAASFGENMGKIAGVVGPAIGKGAVAAGKGLAGFAKSIMDGAKEGNKKNAQTNEAPEESFQSWRDAHYGVEGKTAADQALLKGESYNKALDFGQRADLAARYAADMVRRRRGGRKNAEGSMERLGRNVVYLLADMSNQFTTDGASRAPRDGLAGREVRLNRLTTELHGIYGPNAPEVLAQFESMLGPDVKEAVKYMAKELEQQMTPRGVREYAAKRDLLAQETVALVPTQARIELMKMGVNLNIPRGREEALQLMEDYADGIGGSRSAAARKTLDRLFSPEGVDGMLAYLNGQEEVQKEKVVDDRGEIEGMDRDGPTESDNLDIDAFEAEVADKLVVKGSGPKVYAYGNGAGLRSSDERRDPFASTDKVDPKTGIAKRPQLFEKGQKLFGGEDAIEKKIADLKAKLVADPDYPDHDNYRVEAKSAYDVMQDNRMQPGKVLQLYRDYLTADSNIEGATAASALLNQLVRARNGTNVATPEERRARKGRAEAWLAANPGKSLEDYKAAESARRVAAMAEPIAKMMGEAKEYFQSRYIVTAEQLSNRDPEKISVTEVLNLVKSGRNKLDNVRKDAIGMSEADEKIAASEANILYFTGKDEKGKNATLPVQAGSLVYLVRQQLGKTSRMDVDEKGKSFSNKTKDDEYLSDLMHGITMMVDSGHVTGMPYMLDRFGKAESFNKDVPSSLMMATQTYGTKKFADEKRREKQTPKTVEQLAPNEDDVIADQARNAEFFTPEDLAEREMQESAWSADKRRSGKNDTSTAASARDEGGELITREAGRGTSTSIRVDVSGKRAVEAKTDKTNRTPLDFSKGQGKGVDDETTDVLKRTKMGGKSAYSTDIGPEAKGKAADEAVRRAEAIGAAWNRNEAEAKAMIEMRFRMAAAPAFSKDQNTAVGGPHYIAPVASFVSSKNLGQLDLGPAEMKEMVGIQSRVAQVLLGEGVSKTERVKLARLMSTDPTKVTAGNVDGMLAKLVARGGAAAPLGKPSGDRKLNAMAVKVHTDLGRDGFAATHDSPIKHEGKFDWRAHQGKGEGNASFGAGTYLSTADGVHKSYKNQFTAVVSGSSNGIEAAYKITSGFSSEHEIIDAIKKLGSDAAIEKLRNAAMMAVIQDPSSDYENGESPAHAVVWRIKSGSVDDLLRSILAVDAKPDAVSPTYEVSVDIKPEQLLDWNKSITEQSEAVQKALKGEMTPEIDWDESRSPDGGFGSSATYGDFKFYLSEDLDGAVTLQWTSSDDQGVDSFRNIAAAKNAAVHMAGGRTGGEFYSELAERLGSQTKASDYLQSLGILGHKYAASGGRNDTHPNYVIYDDSKITTNYVHFNNQDGAAKVSTQTERDEAVAYALKVLGPKIKVSFKDITGYSGEFIEAKNAIEISTMAAAGTMNTLYHEAMHKFFADFVRGNPKVQAVFETLVNDPKHIQRLHSLLDGYPAAQAQLTSGEERLAYTYQFWKAGLLQVDAKAHTWLQKVGKFFRGVLGMVRDSERALELFEAFDQGKMSEPSAAGKVIAKAMGDGSTGLKLRRKMDGMLQGLAALTFPAAEILGNSKSPTARKLSTMMFTNPGEEAHGKEAIGMMNARRSVSQQYTNTSNRRFENMNQTDIDAVQKYLQQGVDPSTIKVDAQREAVADVRNLLDRFHKYMTDAGMKIGKIDNYYPVVWNPDRLNANKAEFISMLTTKYADKMNAADPAKAAERIWQSLVDKEGVDAHLPVGREDGVLSPFFASQEQRTLPWLEAADREKYLDKDMALTLTRYFAQGAHATEYFRRFGENGKKLDKMLADIRTELSGLSKEMVKRGEIADDKERVKWVGRQMRDVSQSVGAMEGSLGKDVGPNMRAFNSWMAVYQNIRLLPMALFSSFVDPLALVARGAPWQAAYETFTYSMREVFRGWADVFKDMPPERQKDEWRKLSELIGASEIAAFQGQVADQYSSTYMTPGAKKINDKMFVFNGMEAWNRGSRIMATKWAVNFIETHSATPDKIHSKRWLTELGLTPSMITLDDGKLVTSPQQLSVLKGITLDEARSQIAPIHDALNRWVEGAVLTPNAAQRPAWSSDPRWATMFHLKQFSYSFHQTILKRAANEFSKGNMQPLGALAMFVPTMIGADIIKGLIQGAGTLPPYMAGMNAGDWLLHGAQRAGLAGIGSIGMDAGADWASIGGPAFEQIIDGARDGFGSASALKAMPLNSLYGNLVTS